MKESAARLSSESAAMEFVKNAFGHLKATAFDDGARILLHSAGIEPDAGVVDAVNVGTFINAAKTRSWDREPQVRTMH